MASCSQAYFFIVLNTNLNEHAMRKHTGWQDKFLELCVYAYIHTYMHTYIHTYIYTYIQTCIHSYIHTSIHTYIHTYIHQYKLVHISTHQYTLVYISTHQHTSVHISTRQILISYEISQLFGSVSASAFLILNHFII